jgi:2-polyprenyl-3-methyl-5-hydroxy-6-metoxy-1,4-benzoquinol methylase
MLTDSDLFNNKLSLRIYDKETLNQHPDATSLIKISIFDELVGVLAIEYEKHYDLIPKQSVQQLGISESELFKIARQNISGKKVLIPKDDKNGVELFMFYSTNDSAFLLCDFEKNCIVQKYAGENFSYGEYGSLVAAPNLGSLFVVPLIGKNLEEAIKQITEKTFQFYSVDPGKVSYKVFWYYNGKGIKLQMNITPAQTIITVPEQLKSINNINVDFVTLKGFSPNPIPFNNSKTTHNYFDKCLACSSSELKKQITYSDFFLVKCSKCNFVFTQRIPTFQEFEYTYRKYGRNAYLSPITIKRFNELLDEFEKHRKTNKILDVGCGEGAFLIEAQKRGWEAHGTEYGENTYQRCLSKGIKMQKGILEPSNYEKGSFDIITSFEVIEHINNPREEINNISSLIRPGGLFYCTTPNFNALGRFLLNKNYSILHYPEHLSYYTPKTLTHLLEQFHFKKLKVFSSGISISRIQLSNFQKHSGKTDPVAQIVNNSTPENILHSKSSADEKIRIEMETKPHLKFVKYAVNAILRIFGVGMTIKGYYIKK